MQEAQVNTAPAHPATDSKPKTSTEDLAEQAGRVVEDVKALGGMTRDAAAEAVQGAAERGSAAVAEYEDQVIEYVRKQPVKSILIAAGAGYLLGGFFRR